MTGSMEMYNNQLQHLNIKHTHSKPEKGNWTAESKMMHGHEVSNNILNAQQKQMIEHLKGNFESVQKQGNIIKQFTERNVFNNHQSLNNQDSLNQNKFAPVKFIQTNNNGVLYSRS